MIDYPKLLGGSSDAVLRDPRELGLCLVTGAAGFLGSHLVDELLAQGCRVRALVHRAPLPRRHERLTFVSGSVGDRRAMFAATDGVDTIFHTAAAIALLGGPHVDARYFGAAYETNVVGTRHLLAAARATGARRFVHTSTVDVCFEYGEQPAMTEATGYSRSRRSVYQQTKILAEESVLGDDGREGLHTCAIRPGGMYGPAKNEMLDRMVSQLARGLRVARIGDGSAKMDFSEVHSLVHGQILAALHLGTHADGRSGVANGQVYFVNDGVPMNAFEFFRPIAEALGHRMPTRTIPGEWLLPALLLFERVALLAGLSEPPLCPHAIQKVIRTHWSRIDKAERELGYRPLQGIEAGVEACVPHCRSVHAAIRPRAPRTRSLPALEVS